jgi:hypothetical protein
MPGLAQGPPPQRVSGLAAPPCPVCAANVERSRCILREPHEGQTGSASRSPARTISSVLFSHEAQRNSRIGIRNFPRADSSGPAARV